ncbi:transposase [Thermosynechococcus sp. HN-54]|uniref:RNA-guided endonuclease InsQ/TnpB family protein n=1 Tax=Thermosynechococcus sp. HN-54 TaxID=2933959 RepID=UPI00202CDDC0|nr:transposase [Thermosynechococcus sp. HN-54]URR35234.1 transposase [Thermosynechococcus sp. HN-54]
MEQTLTVVCKLRPTPEQSLEIERFLKAFADACNFTNKTVQPTVTNKITIQNMVYRELRSRFGLSANQAVRVCARVGANRQTAKLKGKVVKAFNSTSADFDARIFAFREKDELVRLTLLGRRETLQLDIGEYQREKLRGRRPTAAQLCKHRDGFYYIHIQITEEVPQPSERTTVIGVDLGRREIAKTSTGRGWDGNPLNELRDRFHRVRASIQKRASQGTRSSRRACRKLLKRLAGQERRFQEWLNHSISAAIVREAKALNAVIAIEDLTGIRERLNQQPRSKTERRRSNCWSFYQLRQLIEYKCLREGVRWVAVNPAYTSQTCHRCLQIHPEPLQSYRKGKEFACGHCGWQGDADLNGALVISSLGKCVTLARSSGGLACQIA